MADRWTDDDALLRDLADAVAEGQAVPADFVATGKALYTWRTVDAELAALIHDSASGEPADERLAGAVRSGPAARRSLTFQTGQFTVEVDLDRAPDAIRGQFVAHDASAVAGELTVEPAEGAALTAAVDELGYFAVAALPRSRFRLRLRPGAGREVVTPWILP